MNELQQAAALLEKANNLIISYAGLNIQEPEMFPQPQGWVLIVALTAFVVKLGQATDWTVRTRRSFTFIIGTLLSSCVFFVLGECVGPYGSRAFPTGSSLSVWSR